MAAEAENEDGTMRIMIAAIAVSALVGALGAGHAAPGATPAPLATAKFLR